MYEWKIQDFCNFILARLGTLYIYLIFAPPFTMNVSKISSKWKHSYLNQEYNIQMIEVILYN